MKPIHTLLYMYKIINCIMILFFSKISEIFIIKSKYFIMYKIVITIKELGIENIDRLKHTLIVSNTHINYLENIQKISKINSN